MKKPTATAPKINNGFDEFVKETRRSASILVNCLSCLSLVVNFAPEGKPEAIPIASTNPPTPGTRKMGRINGSNNTPTNLTIPKLINSSDKIKKEAMMEIQPPTTLQVHFLTLAKRLVDV